MKERKKILIYLRELLLDHSPSIPISSKAHFRKERVGIRLEKRERIERIVIIREPKVFIQYGLQGLFGVQSI